MLFNRIKKHILWIIVGISMVGCIESSFVLAPESRLPKWFNEPNGLPRSEYRVTMDYLTNGDAVFKLFKSEGDSHIKTVTGTTQGDRPRKLKITPSGFPKNYPLYEIITVNGITEIIEHRKMEPMFYVVDDPLIYRKFGVENK